MRWTGSHVRMTDTAPRQNDNGTAFDNSVEFKAERSDTGNREILAAPPRGTDAKPSTTREKNMWLLTLLILGTAAWFLMMGFREWFASHAGPEAHGRSVARDASGRNP
ncbi:MAG: hypothetical protein CSB44_09090 [Gammaproteobacteria bacterium]|nr:MAG: hypothetical protein CSB44_09090 [Gammaproteobacteria bacterium]